MSFYSKLRRVMVNEGSVYKANQLFDIVTEEFDARNFLFDDKIPHEYRVYDPHKPVNEIRDIRKLCERDLSKLGRNGTLDIEIKTTDDILPEENFGSTYCSLYNTYQHIQGDSKKDNFIDDLSRVFWFVRPNIYDNRVKFHNLMRLVLRGDQEHIVESIKTLSDKIRVTYTDGGVESTDIKKTLDRIHGKESLSVDELRNELNTTKYQAYTLYEKSFEKGPFVRSSKIFRLKYKEALEEDGFKHVLDVAYNKIYNSKFITHEDQKHANEVINEASQKIHKAIIDLYVNGQASKADLSATENVTDTNGDVVIKSGSLVEVKMRDYSIDSYLSEFLSIYKDSNIHPKYKSPEMLEIYNKVITSLYEKIKIDDGGMLTDIKNNFSGMFFGEKTIDGKQMPVYIPKESINLYWSDRGKIESNNQKRLTIRYSVNDNPYLFYYDRDTFKLVYSNISENINIDEIGEVLIEGRKEQAREKYPDVSEDVYEFFINNDPSGNHKYIDWLMRNHEKGHVYAAALLRMGDVKFFHQHPQLFTSKDINRYDDDSLQEAVAEGRVELEKKEKEKAAKKQRDIVYKDDRWLVISPKTYIASCYYGAGTKWCVTTKNTDTHWNSYSRNATFFFIIDNTKTQEDPLYKVAYRLIGNRARLELWDATDREFSKYDSGSEYLTNLPNKMNEDIMSYHKIEYPEGDGTRNKWIDTDSRAQSLANHLDHFEIENLDDTWYSGLHVYLDSVEDQYYAIGDVDDVDGAMADMYDYYGDDELSEYYDYDGYYLTLDEEEYITNEVSEIINSYTDREILEYGGYEDSYDEIQDTLGELTSDNPRVMELETELVDLLNEANNHASTDMTNEWERCFRNGVVDCLVHERGLYSDATDLFKSGMVTLDRDNLIKSLVDTGDYESLNAEGYDTSRDDEGVWWYLFRVDY